MCSVLFCDLVGFTPLSEARDPEAVRELLSGYFAVARTVIGRYGGVVEKFIGDAVMAVWGTPVAAEGDAERAVRANLADTVTGSDPAAQLRRAGARLLLATAVVNLAQALLMTGDWDGAGAELAPAADADGLGGIEFLACYRAWLAALRGDAPAAGAALAGLGGLRASEDPQDQALIAVAEAFTAAALGRAAVALRHARDSLTHADVLGISQEALRWAWPLAARATYDLRDTAATRELLSLIDGYQPGHLAPMLRAERDLARARLAAGDGELAAAPSFAAAITGLRELSTPYHLAHGLLDQAEYLVHTGDSEAAAAVVDEACDIAGRLRCQPLLDRAEAIERAKPRIRA